MWLPKYLYIYVLQAYKESVHSAVVDNQTDSYNVNVGWIRLHFQNTQIEHIPHVQYLHLMIMQPKIWYRWLDYVSMGISDTKLNQTDIYIEGLNFPQTIVCVKLSIKVVWNLRHDSPYWYVI